MVASFLVECCYRRGNADGHKGAGGLCGRYWCFLGVLGSRVFDISHCRVFRPSPSPSPSLDHKKIFICVRLSTSRQTPLVCCHRRPGYPIRNLSPDSAAPFKVPNSDRYVLVNDFANEMKFTTRLAEGVRKNWNARNHKALS